MISFKNKKITTVYFDMDGVLFDSMPLHAASWIEAFKSKGVDFDPYLAYLNEGRTGSATIQNNFVNKIERQATPEEIEDIYRTKTQYIEKHQHIPAIKDMPEFVSFLKSEGYDLWIVTGSGQPSLLEKINNTFPDCFSAEKMITGMDVEFGKPHPEPYLKAIAKSKIKAANGVVIENAPLGVQSAVSAGLFTLAINTGILETKVLVDAGADCVFPDVAELKNWWMENS